MNQVTADASAGTYSTTPAVLDSTLSYLRTTNVSVQTIDQALDEVIPQLGN